jgi:hypothetical protein
MNDSDTPEYGRIPEATRRYGLSRTRLYLLAGENAIRFIKVGNATLVDFASVRDYLRACPSQIFAHLKPPETKPPRARLHPERRIVSRSQAATAISHNPGTGSSAASGMETCHARFKDDPADVRTTFTSARAGDSTQSDAGRGSCAVSLPGERRDQGRVGR